MKWKEGLQGQAVFARQTVFFSLKSPQAVRLSFRSRVSTSDWVVWCIESGIVLQWQQPQLQFTLDSHGCWVQRHRGRTARLRRWFGRSWRPDRQREAVSKANEFKFKGLCLCMPTAYSRAPSTAVPATSRQAHCETLARQRLCAQSVPRRMEGAKINGW